MCEFRECATGYSCCNTQSRSASTLINCTASFNHTVIDTGRWAAGRHHASSFWLVIWRNYRLIYQKNVATVSFDGCYGEQFRTLGYIGPSGTATFTNCHFQFLYGTHRPPAILESASPVTLTGCQFHQQSTSNNYLDVLNFAGNNRLHFIGCSFGTGGFETKFIGYGVNSSVCPSFVNCRKRTASGQDNVSVGLPAGGYLNQHGARGLSLNAPSDFAQAEEGLFVFIPGSAVWDITTLPTLALVIHWLVRR